MQLHWSADQYADALSRIDFVEGDLTAPALGIDASARRRIAERTDSVLHIAASLNRKSDKACFNANLRGTLSVIKLAREIVETRGSLGRFSFVSTTAVCGRREHEVLEEDAQLLEFLAECRLPALLVATKLDKLGRSQVEPALRALRQAAGTRVLGFSAETGLGREQLLRALLEHTGVKAG